MTTSAAILSRFSWEAEAGIDCYYAAVKVGGQIVSNCEHRHRARETAERCAEKIARLLADPSVTYPTPTWRA